ncbi:hypothetical protein [Mucilaginibacter pedocola]|uniref:hypothetical protein n=1 Tax=Mucilaginibacter pedocola TaxID=1792845 RepID=UPI001EE3D14D|nr:hypothetical protein [Mucilaginibacter pedocola]
MRIFTRVREMLLDNTELRLEIEKIKKELNNQGKNMEVVFKYLDELSAWLPKARAIQENGSGINLTIYNYSISGKGGKFRRPRFLVATSKVVFVDENTSLLGAQAASGKPAKSR